MRKPNGSARRHRGKWTARVRWSEPQCSLCSHHRTLHAGRTPRRCSVCDCVGYVATRREWRRLAEPNTKAVALELAREQVRRLASGERDTAQAAKHLLRDVAAEYLALYVCAPIYSEGVKLRGMKDHAGVRADVTRVLLDGPLADRFVEEITFIDCQRLRDARLAAPKLRGGKTVVVAEGTRSVARVNREMSAVRAVFNFAVDAGYIARNPMLGSAAGGRKRSLVTLSAEKVRDRVMTRDEERRLHSAYLGDASIRRSHDYFTVCVDTGLRESEMCGLPVSACDFAEGLIRLPWEITKSKKPRSLPMSARVRDILARRCAGRDRGALVFADLSPSTIRKDFLRAKSIAQISDLHLHDCRATLATRLMEAGVSLQEISMLTGHSFRSSGANGGTAPVLQKHYLRLTPDILTRAGAAIDDVADDSGAVM